MSPGRPRTRSAMMFFRISSVPPAIRRPGADITEAWNAPLSGASSGSLMMPYWSSISRASLPSS
eukprot:gene2863-3764_t